ncbi:hypothetical protein CDL12_07417 [Handroanthus impetiginosus]|uniref:Uncharacterized protein n=1 Tax=Handroanthus impetiginosus TaxID=429701 RepID=A0A2G9HQW0_9LAMI|nr:hypothetical protein CDL12_07417 [Handroanthus impetiginosus]
MDFYETCPHLKFARFAANQAILEAFAGKTRVHVIDFSMKQGMQWPAMLQALALRPGGPPSFRLTGIGPPSHDDEVGWKLAQSAETINIEFEYRGFVANSLADLDASMFDIREGETVAVNSIFELHQLLARPGAVENVLRVVRELKPEILTVVEQEANHKGSVFDSLENRGNAVAAANGGDAVAGFQWELGSGRPGFHETLAQWRTRLGSAGFQQQASMILALFAEGDAYGVEQIDGCLMLGWHTRPAITASAWKLS